jgi:hypothetical protein
MIKKLILFSLYVILNFFSVRCPFDTWRPDVNVQEGREQCEGFVVMKRFPNRPLFGSTSACQLMKLQGQGRMWGGNITVYVPVTMLIVSSQNHSPKINRKFKDEFPSTVVTDRCLSVIRGRD